MLETHLGFRWTMWKGLQLLGGFRNARFDGVGLDLQPGGAVTQTDSEEHSVGYEGYYVSLAYTY